MAHKGQKIAIPLYVRHTPCPPAEGQPCHDFRCFTPFSLSKSQAPTLVHSTHDMFSLSLSYTVFIVSYLFLSSHLLSYLLNRSFRISRTTRSIWRTRRLVPLGLPRKDYLLWRYWSLEPHCEEVGIVPLQLLQHRCPG